MKLLIICESSKNKLVNLLQRAGVDLYSDVVHKLIKFALQADRSYTDPRRSNASDLESVKQELLSKPWFSNI